MKSANEALENEQFENETVRLSGDLTLETVPSIYQQMKPSDSTIDLAGVERVDSSGLALLLQWQAEAQSPYEIINAPQNLLRLAELCEADEVLQLQGRRIST